MKTNHLLLIFLLCSPAVWGQWSGTLEGTLGGNWNKAHKENVALLLNMDTAKYHLRLNLSGGHNFTPTLESTSTVNTKGPAQSNLKYDEKKLYTRNWNVKGGVGLNYNIDTLNVLDVSAIYAYIGKKDYPTQQTEFYQEDTIYGEQCDSIAKTTHNISPKLEFVHTFAKRDNRILLSLSSAISFTEDLLIRGTQGKFYTAPKHYATRSYMVDGDSKISLFYEDKSLAKVPNLYLKGGTDFFWHTDLDIYDKTKGFVRGPLLDSLSQERSFLYNSLALEPFIHVAYAYKGFDFFVNERVQYYRHILTDQLAHTDYHFHSYRWQNILAAGIGYRFNPRHKLNMDYKRTLKRPEYEKFSPVLTIGTTHGEYFWGNSNLRPQTMDDVSLNYNFRTEHFSTDLTLGYRCTRDKVEKVILVRPQSTDTSVIYTYTNANLQHTAAIMLYLTADYAVVKGQIWFGTYDDFFMDQHNRLNKNDFSYEVGISLTAQLTDKTQLGSEIIYHSPKMSAYSLKGEYIGANIHLTQQLIKNLNLIISLNDLIDKPVEETTWNKDFTYYQMKEKYFNRRCLQLQLQYKF